MAETLKPCPFCGGVPMPWVQSLDDDIWAVCCEFDCGNRGPRRTTEAEAIAAWNRRSEPQGEQEQWIGVGWGGVRYFDSEDRALEWAREEAALCPYADRVGDIHIPVHRILADRTIIVPPQGEKHGIPV